jgi:hypothetical protein
MEISIHISTFKYMFVFIVYLIGRFERELPFNPSCMWQYFLDVELRRVEIIGLKPRWEEPKLQGCTARKGCL